MSDVIVYTKKHTYHWQSMDIQGLRATATNGDTSISGVYRVLDSVPTIGGIELINPAQWRLEVEVPEISKSYNYVAWLYDHETYLAFRDGHPENHVWVLNGERVTEWQLLERASHSKIAALEIVK